MDLICGRRAGLGVVWPQVLDRSRRFVFVCPLTLKVAISSACDMWCKDATYCGVGGKECTQQRVVVGTYYSSVWWKMYQEERERIHMDATNVDRESALR